MLASNMLVYSFYKQTIYNPFFLCATGGNLSAIRAYRKWKNGLFYLTSIRHSQTGDRIVVLKDGKVEEQGSHKQQSRKNDDVIE